MEANSNLRSFARHQIIYFPGDAGQTVLVLARGRVKIKSVTSDGRESILTFIDEGELFGELAILDAAPRGEFAEAVEPSQVLAVPRGDIVWLMERRPEVALHVTKLFGFRFAESKIGCAISFSLQPRTGGCLALGIAGHARSKGFRRLGNSFAIVASGPRQSDWHNSGNRDGYPRALAARRVHRSPSPADSSVEARARLMAESDTTAPTDRTRPMVRPQ